MHYVNKDVLIRTMRATLQQFGLPEQDVEKFIQGLIQPSLRGVDSHGVRLFETYLKEIKGGRSKANPQITPVSEFGAICQLDADHALGIVAGYRGVDTAISLADKYGISFVTVSNSNHFGAASNYTLEAARKGYLCLCFSNSDALVAPENGTDMMFGTNPISFAAPSGENSAFCLDMATSQVSLSKILRAISHGEDVRPDWAVGYDKENKKVGALKALGGYKGQGLAMMVSILTNLLTGNPLDNELSHLYQPPYDQYRNISHSFICIKYDLLIDKDTFLSNLNRFLDSVRNGTKLGDKPIVVAGDLEEAEVIKRTETGIPMTDEEFDFFSSLVGFEHAA